mgnify:CR=1 FL=1
MRVVLHPLLGRQFIQLSVRLVLASDLGVLRIIRLGRAHERLQRDESCANREGRRPLILENIKADGSSLRADIRVPNLRLELHLGRLERVVWRNYYVDVEDATLVARVFLY